MSDNLTRTSSGRPGGEATPSGDSASALGAPLAQIGRYRILRVIGEGGMGTVYEAEQDKPRRTVALKVIKPGFARPRCCGASSRSRKSWDGCSTRASRRSTRPARPMRGTASSRVGDGSLGNQPEIEAAIDNTLGKTYAALGLYPEAHLRAALEIRRRSNPRPPW